MAISFPMKKMGEKEVLEKLGCDNFRQVSKDKILEFCSLYQQMDPEVAKAAIAQIPEFTKTLLSAAEDYKETLMKTVDANGKSLDAVFKGYDAILDTLRDRVGDKELSEDEKRYYIDKMVEVAKMKDAKDRENKDFLLKVGGMAACVLVAVIGAAAAAIGGKVDINLPGAKG